MGPQSVGSPSQNPVGSCIDPQSVRGPSPNSFWIKSLYRSSKAGGAEVEILEDQIKSCKAQTMDEGMSDRGSSLGIVSVHT